MVVGMSDAVARHRHAAERLAWYEAAKRGGKAVVELLDSWGESDKTTWYATNSREGVRDETFPAWRGNGALLLDESVPATSSRGRYSLAPDFAKLLDPALAGDDLTQRVREWQDRNLTMTAPEPVKLDGTSGGAVVVWCFLGFDDRGGLVDPGLGG
jgi:hypothetical protein